MRPDGANQIHGGVILLLFAVATFSLSFFMPPHVAPGLALLSAGLAGLGFPILIAGWIIHAIWHLPGKEDAIRTTDKPTLVLDEHRQAEGRA
ncbi:hypothetical protein [Sphingobium agri]|uniref:Uncharacterized protein n=1 Tax=Sphingobium agri TaxID=2933566 RepID=A0ABT0DXC1_9SPHN|nr:hypothetical protein [Sphingobium agri]MCK0531776.1 hypothetical protein [Sphingobium agri]